MDKTIQNNFTEAIIINLKNNGFPQKRVSLPLEKMYEIADKKGLNFNTILEELETESGILHQKDNDKIIFFEAPKSPFDSFTDLNQNDFDFKNMSKEQIMDKIQDVTSKLSPEQMASIQEMYSKMTPEQRDEIMKQGKDMGLI